VAASVAEGSCHDKRIADQIASPLPEGSELLQDLGFVGFTLAGWKATTTYIASPLFKQNDLQSIGMVESERQVGTKTSHKTRSFISSRAADVRAFATRVRGHWQIENQLHWRLDVIFAEDNAHIRVNHGPENMAVLRHMAINVLKHESTPISIQSKRLQAACSNEHLEKVINVSR